MTFTSWIFLFSLPIVIGLDRALSLLEPSDDQTPALENKRPVFSIHSLRQGLLLVASCLLYLTFGVENLLFLLLITIFLFAVTRYADGVENSYRKTVFAFIAFIPLSLLLGVDKIKFLLSYLPEEIRGTQPMALSFVVFSALSYIFDVRDQKVRAADYNMLELALYLSFFPKLLQGPIALARDFLPQMKVRRKLPDLDGFTQHVKRFIRGFCVKLLIADQLVVLSDPISMGATDGVSIVLGMVFFYFRIFLDFASYSAMAIAVAGIFGFQIKENFELPYRSVSFGEFWHRWHISLGTFFREYVYIPLGGSRAGSVYLNTMVVFALTGLWHGNGMLFLMWGLMHGLMICIERYLDSIGWLTKIPTWLRWAIVQPLIVVSWLPFYHSSLREALTYVLRIFTRAETINYTYQYFLRPYPLTLLIISIFIAFKPGYGYAQPLLDRIRGRYPQVHLVVSGLVTCVLLVLSLYALAAGAYQPFLYFRF